ncbi:hypothetical protein SAMN04515617_104147 [Collimonas sp. OK242]|uniref:hypothetical protein n=1 Tax=Collimonas sp. OK242 TaxID=1798195 RepID=UPI000897F7C5|nr:hypothetical protein [Collimonas sp. OK242]SDX50062.1 hypothetical protein SAMN04515617_104147 [Collimonas sp. OK242]
MKSFNSFFILVLWVTCFLIFIFIFPDGSYSRKYEYSVLPPPPVLQQTPAGELTAGFRLEQPIDWNLINNFKRPGSDTLCIDILLANYNNRDNTGTFAVSLRAGHFSQKILFNTRQVHDNAYQRFCYDELPLQNIADKPAALVLEGIDSPAGKAVTAWMTSDTTRGKARRDNRELDWSLMFSIDAVTESNKRRTQAIILTLLCGLSVSILFWPSKNKLY